MLHTELSDRKIVEERVPRRKAYHHGNLKRALIEKAIEIIKEEGVAGLSLRKAARKVGVSHAAPAHHFGDLVGLLSAISEEGFGLLLQKMNRVMDDIVYSDSMARLRDICLTYINFALEHTYYFKVMYSSRLAEKSVGGELDKCNRKVYRCLADCVADCRDYGQVETDDPLKMALFVWTTIHGYATLAVDGQISNREFQSPDGRTAEMVADMACMALRRDRLVVLEGLETVEIRSF